MLFKELTKLSMEALAKQQSVTLEQAKAQTKRVQERISKKKEVPDKKITEDPADKPISFQAS